jgi:hypothetical protein
MMNQIVNRPKLNIDSTREVILTMSEGNPGAIGVLMQLIQDPTGIGLIDILNLDDMDMRGSQIWVAYKDHCKGDLDAFKKALRDRDQSLVDAVNTLGSHAPGTPKAVIGGASFRR